MAKSIVASLAVAALALGCSSENTNAGLMGEPATDGGTEIGADAEGEAAAEDAADAPCTSMQHFNGYSFFPDCHEIGDYDETLALVACGVYMGVNCEVLTSLNLCNGTNLVGHKSDAWIVWTWTATTGTTRLSWTTPPECPTASDPVWW